MMAIIWLGEKELYQFEPEWTALNLQVSLHKLIEN